MVLPSLRCSAVLLLALSVAAGAEAESSWTDMRMEGSDANFTAVLRVENRAGVPVRLMGCGDREVAPDESATLTLAGLSRCWVVPGNATVDGHIGASEDRFYLVTDFTGSKAMAGIGYGHEHKPQGRDEKKQGAGTARDAASAGGGGMQERPGWSNSSIAGLELTAGPPCSGNCSLHCRADGCNPDMTIAIMPDEFTLTIMGAQPSLLSYWWGGDGGWDHGHGHGWDHGHGGEDGRDHGHGHGGDDGGDHGHGHGGDDGWDHGHGHGDDVRDHGHGHGGGDGGDHGQGHGGNDGRDHGHGHGGDDGQDHAHGHGGDDGGDHGHGHGGDDGWDRGHGHGGDHVWGPR